jgi:hypothetical protein
MKNIIVIAGQTSYSHNITLLQSQYDCTISGIVLPLNISALVEAKQGSNLINSVNPRKRREKTQVV